MMSAGPGDVEERTISDEQLAQITQIKEVINSQLGDMSAHFCGIAELKNIIRETVKEEIGNITISGETKEKGIKQVIESIKFDNEKEKQKREAEFILSKMYSEEIKYQNRLLNIPYEFLNETGRRLYVNAQRMKEDRRKEAQQKYYKKKKEKDAKSDKKKRSKEVQE
jgi:hypothetical protein